MLEMLMSEITLNTKRTYGNLHGWQKRKENYKGSRQL